LSYQVRLKKPQADDIANPDLVIQGWHPKPLACDPAIVAAWNAGAADLGPNLVHAAGCSFPDFPKERAASRAVTTHTAFIVRHEPLRDRIDLGIGL
jgi:phage tail protein X